jgi:hypothetical protein|tara:strand:- start:3506 stop:3724 length:219 start_codon:yes stop_codon:yes gene_type:complete
MYSIFKQGKKIMIVIPKKEKVENLVDWIVESMDVSELESYVKENLEEYYNSPAGVEDFDTNYAEMKEIKGDD